MSRGYTGLPAAIADYYTPRVRDTILHWYQVQDWIAVNFPERVHRWHYTDRGWVANGCPPMSVVDRSFWNSETKTFVGGGRYLMNVWSDEDVWFSLLAALDPFFLASFCNGTYDPNHQAKLAHQLTHILPAKA